MKKRIYCLLTSAILLGSISTPCFANTLSNTTNKTSSNIMQIMNTESQLIEFLRANDVDNSTQKKLIEKFNKGEKWDSWKSSEGYTEKIKLKDGSIKYIFKDGSIYTTRITDTTKKQPSEPSSRAAADISTWSAHILKHKTNTVYQNVKVSFNNGRVAAYFYSDFCVVHKGRSFIQETYEEHINPNPDISTGYIHKVFKKDHKSEDGRYPATASLSFDLKIHKPDSTSSFSASYHNNGASYSHQTNNNTVLQHYVLYLKVGGGDFAATVFY